MGDDRNEDGRSGVDDSELEAKELDDVDDRDELRERYYGLIQETRVALPGVQVLMAFLLTAPFAERFGDLDELGRGAYLLALLSAMGAVICLLAPAVFHRVAERTARSARLTWGVRFVAVGLALIAVALVSATWCVTRLLFDTPTANVVGAGAVVAFAITWLTIPLVFGHRKN